VPKRTTRIPARRQSVWSVTTSGTTRPSTTRSAASPRETRELKRKNAELEQTIEILKAATSSSCGRATRARVADHWRGLPVHRRHRGRFGVAPICRVLTRLDATAAAARADSLRTGRGAPRARRTSAELLRRPGERHRRRAGEVAPRPGVQGAGAPWYHSPTPESPGEDGRLRPPAAGASRRRSRRIYGVQKLLTDKPRSQCLGVNAAPGWSTPGPPRRSTPSRTSETNEGTVARSRGTPRPTGTGWRGPPCRHRCTRTASRAEPGRTPPRQRCNRPGCLRG
jgi:hypothetical protein